MFGSTSFTPVSLFLVLRMQFASSRSSLFCAMILTTLQLWGSLSASTSSQTLPTPTLEIYSRSRDSVVLVCRAPEGHPGIQFMLYHESKQKVDSQDLQSAAQVVQFNIRMEGWNSGQSKLFCCLYKNQKGQYSAFSHYLQLEDQNAPGPTHSNPSVPAPLLSVEPSTGVVKRGDMISFHCTVPPHPHQQQSQSYSPATFLLLRNTAQTKETTVIPQLHASQVSNSEATPGIFTVGPVRGGEAGEYTCLYQTNQQNGRVNSTVSNVVQIIIRDMLPVPTLVLQQETDVWHFLCSGSPAYPGAVFSLFQVDNEHPVNTSRVKMIYHQATFPMPVQDTPVALYQCQYSVLLGRRWSISERSAPLTVTKEISPPASPGRLTGVDWPLVLGSLSAALLFLCSLAIVAVVARRKVNTAAEEKKRRQEAQFWTQVHGKDHVVDLALRRTSFTSQEWASVDAETGPRSSVWHPLSTFTKPIH